MNVTDILTLAKAGFTAEQIGKLMTIDAPAPAPKTAPAPSPAPDDTKAQFDKIFQQISALTGIVQKGNIANTHQPDEKTLTAEDVLSEIIRPNNGGVNNG